MSSRVALLIAAVLVPLAFAEAGLRLAGFEVPQFHERDALVGLTLRPNAEGWYTDEGRAWVKVNSAGMRDVERSRAKPAGRLRIAVLGDSYTEAIQVARERAYPALLERELAACGVPAEVLNFGVSGFGTAQELLTLRSKVWDYAPDFVLLAFFPSNDVINNSRALEPDRLRPFFVVRDGELVLDDSFREARSFRILSSAPYRFLRQHSRLFMLALQARKNWAALRATWEAKEDEREPGLDWAVFRPPASPAWREAWDVTERLLAAMADEVERHGTSMAIAVVPEAAAVHPDRAARKRAASQLGLRDFLYPERRIARLAQREGIPVLALTEKMDALGAGAHLHGFGESLGSGHWNEAGHRVAAKLMGEFLCRRPELRRAAAPVQSGDALP